MILEVEQVSIKRETSTTRRRSWAWTEMWGPQLHDITDWTVTTTGGQITLRRAGGRGHTEIAMSREVAGNVVDALSEALDDEAAP